MRISGETYYSAIALPEDVVEFPEAELFLASVRDVKRAPLDVALSRVEGTTIGCDPEFLVVSKTGVLRDAGALLPFDGKVGSDGILGELRPSPSSRVAEVLMDMKLLIGKLESQGFNISASSSYPGRITVGFHLHFGTPKEILAYAPDGAGQFMKTVAEALDVFVGLPSMLRDPDDSRRVGAINYGMPADFRASDLTFEYRTAGGYNLRSFRLAGSLMDVGLLAYNDILKRASLFTKGWSDMSAFNTYDQFREAYDLPSRAEVVAAMTSPDRGRALELSEHSLMCIFKLYAADRHAGSVDMLFDRSPVPDTVFDNWR